MLGGVRERRVRATVAGLAVILAVLWPVAAAAGVADCLIVPAEREARIAALADPDRPFDRARFEGMLHPGACRAAQIDGAEALIARGGDEGSGLALWALVASTLGLLESDDDVQEALVDTILALPAPSWSGALGGFDARGLGPAARAGGEAQWLEPLGAGGSGPIRGTVSRAGPY